MWTRTQVHRSHSRTWPFTTVVPTSISVEGTKGWIAVQDREGELACLTTPGRPLLADKTMLALYRCRQQSLSPITPCSFNSCSINNIIIRQLISNITVHFFLLITVTSWLSIWYSTLHPDVHVNEANFHSTFIIYGITKLLYHTNTVKKVLFSYYSYGGRRPG